MVVDPEAPTTYDSSVVENGRLNTLVFNGGVINVEDPTDTIVIEEVQGTGGEINLAATAKDGDLTGVAKLSIEGVSGETGAPAPRSPWLFRASRRTTSMIPSRPSKCSPMLSAPRAPS